MGFFTRRVSAVPAHPRETFWNWWTSDAAARFSAAAATGQWGGLASEMAEQLAAVHPELSWDTGPGRTSRHVLAVSSEGDPALRRTAELWLRAAPPADEEWEYAAARQPVPDAAGKSIEIDGRSLSLGQARFGLQEDSRAGRLDITVHHPLFGDLPEGRRLQVSFLLLDWILGEDGVTRWVGAVETRSGVETPSHAGTTTAGGTADATASDLLSAVGTLAAQTRTEWALLEGRTPAGGPILVAVRRPLRWIDFPTFDLHTEVRLAYDGNAENGLPTAGSLDLLRGYEAGISAALGTAGILLAHESAAGTRVLHYYSDSEDHSGRTAIEAAARAAGGTIRQDPDPGWTQVRHFA